MVGVLHPLGHGLVHHLGRVAVVGGLLGLELVEEGEVVLILAQVLARLHALAELGLLAADLVFVGRQLGRVDVHPPRLCEVVAEVFLDLLEVDVDAFQGGHVVGEGELTTLRAVEGEVVTLHHDELLPVGLDDHNVLHADGGGRLHHPVACDDVAVLVDEDGTSGAELAEGVLE